jgi:peptidoglycan/LPS O-acetylase OafA/YrhL
LAYRAYSEQLFRRFWQHDVTLVGIGATIVIACVADVPDPLINILLLALLLAAVSNSGRMAGFLQIRLLRWLGDVSYSVYIFQMSAFTLVVGLSSILVEHGLGGWRFEALAALLALGCGVLVHRCIDVPVRAALRPLPGRLAGAYRAIAHRAVIRAPLTLAKRER